MTFLALPSHLFNNQLLLLLSSPAPRYSLLPFPITPAIPALLVLQQRHNRGLLNQANVRI
jgi:hypothetical protein